MTASVPAAGSVTIQFDGLPSRLKSLFREQRAQKRSEVVGDPVLLRHGQIVVGRCCSSVLPGRRSMMSHSTASPSPLTILAIA